MNRLFGWRFPFCRGVHWFASRLDLIGCCRGSCNGGYEVAVADDLVVILVRDVAGALGWVVPDLDRAELARSGFSPASRESLVPMASSQGLGLAERLLGVVERRFRVARSLEGIYRAPL